MLRIHGVTLTLLVAALLAALVHAVRVSLALRTERTVNRSLRERLMDDTRLLTLRNARLREERDTAREERDAVQTKLAAAETFMAKTKLSEWAGKPVRVA